MSNWTSRTLSTFRRRPTKPKLCLDLGGILGAPLFKCQLPDGHTGSHEYNDWIRWDRI